MSDPIEDLKRLGIRLEPDTGHTPYHRAIVSMTPIPNTRTGNICELECGHRVHIFGKIELANGKALCMVCRDAAKS